MDRGPREAYRCASEVSDQPDAPKYQPDAGSSDEIAAFLVLFPPFADLPPDRISDLSRDVRSERYAGGATILRKGGEPAQHLFVVREGIVDLYDDDRLIDHLGEGDVFGISVLSGLGPMLSVLARGKVGCYLIPAQRARELLGTPEGLAYIAGSAGRWAKLASVEQHVLRAGASADLTEGIRAADDVNEVVAVSQGLPLMIGSLLDEGVDPVDIGHAVGLMIDELTRRLIELHTAQMGPPPCSFAWLGLGSAARHEQALGTDQDHAIAYGCCDEDFDSVDPYFGGMAAAVTEGLEACGIPRCRGNVMAENPAWRRTEQGWRRRFEQYVSDRDLMAARITGIAFDYRRVSGVLDIEPTLDGVIRSAGMDQAFLVRLASTVLESRPPVGRKREIVVERGGDHAGKLDLKHGGITIVTNLARFFAIKGGITQNRTLERLASAASMGLIQDRVRDDLEEAFRFLWRLRLTHHVEQADRGEQVDDFIDPNVLSSIARRALPEALHVINDAVVALERQMSTHRTGGRASPR